ncbi:hypothetical protein ID866_2209 [Astraeus odoratus]|nr:hypothetical protein ID866_2209 [Astraeus odoratus]
MTIETLCSPSKTFRSVVVSHGRPTREELITHYPARFTWAQLKAFVSTGDLGLLKRDKKLQLRYESWAADIKKEYGSTINYLVNYRLQWGKPDTLSLLPSALVEPEETCGHIDTSVTYTAPEYFKADIPFRSDLISIIQNDWPYSVPPEIEHTLIWSRVPVFHPDLIPSSIAARIQQDGLCGFTGSNDSIDDLPSLESCLQALADWGVTKEAMVYSPRGSDEEEEMVRNAGKEVSGFVRRRWPEDQWETAWFVNPPRLQSVPELAHIHVFARKKFSEEVPSWDA